MKRPICSLALLLLTLMPAPVPAFQQVDPAEREVIIRVTVPEGAGVVYLAGNRPELGAWDPHKIAMSGTGRSRIARLRVPAGTNLEFKFTLGSWESVETGAAGSDVPNRAYTVPDSGSAAYTGTVLAWRSASSAKRKSTAARSVSILDTEFAMPELRRKRRIWLYLPPDYAKTTKNYPVLYMHDGQNVFDAATSFAGEWGVDETLDGLQARGDWGCIVVAIDNDRHRLDEYNPWVNEANPKLGGGEGDKYVDFLVNTLKPYIDAHYRTRPDRLNTGIAGSSMGGLISLYAALKRPDVFGRAGIFSCSTWLVREKMFAYARSANFQTGSRFYFVIGNSETGGATGEDANARDQRRMSETLNAAGARSGIAVSSHIIADGMHAEWFWRREFPAAYRWLFNAQSK